MHSIGQTVNIKYTCKPRGVNVIDEQTTDGQQTGGRLTP